MMSPGVLIGVATVLIEACGSSSRELTAYLSPVDPGAAHLPAHSEYVALFARRDFRDPFRAGAVFAPRHSRLAAKSLHRLYNAFIICRHNHAVRSLC